jgi:superfamily II DNA/RNA helicase
MPLLLLPLLLLLLLLTAVQGMYELMEIGQSIVFCSTKNGCDAVTAALQAVGFGCSNLHGGLKGEDRDACMDDFRFGRKKVSIH